MDLLNNDYIETKIIDENLIIKTISFPLEKDNILFAKKIINLKTFPYLHSTYSNILKETFDNYSDQLKLQIKANLSKYLREIDKKETEYLNCLSNEQLVEYYCLRREDIKNERSIKFSSIKGGYFIEILLANIFIALGYCQVIPKLLLQWGSLSPTGIDVVFYDEKLNNFYFGECKFYKDAESAIDSCYKDLCNIILGDKLDKEIHEWLTKFDLINENVRSQIDAESLSTKKQFIEHTNLLNCIGFVCADKVNEDKILEKFKTLTALTSSEKYKITLIVMSLETKEALLKACFDEIVSLEKGL